jgi:hypothetical protein
MASKRNDILDYIYTSLTFTSLTKRRSIGLIKLEDVDTTNFPIVDIINGDEIHTPATNEQIEGEMLVLMAVTAKDTVVDTLNDHMDTVVDEMYDHKTMNGKAHSTILSKTETEFILKSTGPRVEYQRAVMYFKITFDN